MPDDPTPKRALPKRIVRLPLAEPYQAFSVDVWANPPNSVIARLNSGTEETPKAFGELIVGHDLVDFDGTPYPADAAEAFELLPTEVALLMIRAATGDAAKLPLLRNGRSRSG